VTTLLSWTDKAEKNQHRQLYDHEICDHYGLSGNNPPQHAPDQAI
jgi:hypothetical protein